MKSSVLNGIIQRLEAMTHTESDVEVRRFEIEGDTFELTDHQSGSVFQYDDIDLVAIEIFEMLG